MLFSHLSNSGNYVTLVWLSPAQLLYKHNQNVEVSCKRVSEALWDWHRSDDFGGKVCVAGQCTAIDRV